MHLSIHNGYIDQRNVYERMLYKCGNKSEFVKKIISFLLFKFMKREHTIGHLFQIFFSKHFFREKKYWNSRLDA